MVGELASAMPEEGGFYQWVRRAMGPFWGFQEAWLCWRRASSIWRSIRRRLCCTWEDCAGVDGGASRDWR